MKNTGLEVLELFAEVSADYRESQIKNLRLGYRSEIANARAKQRWADDNKDLQKLYSRRNYFKRKGQLEKMPRITKQPIRVEIFWEGSAYFYAEPNRPERLGGPFEIAHAAWKHADKMGYQVIDLLKTRGNRPAK